MYMLVESFELAMYDVLLRVSSKIDVLLHKNNFLNVGDAMQSERKLLNMSDRANFSSLTV